MQRAAETGRLDLSAGLSVFPPEIFELADTLEVLNLTGNALESLPDDLPRLHRLRVLFCSDNRFTEMPAVLGRCPGLDIVGFKANRIERVAPGALPPALRWLILTDNRLNALPDSIGACPRLQKLMLAGNRLRRLPAGLARCERLELVRLSANHFDRLEDALPTGLLELPRLAWLAHAGNPYDESRESRAEVEQAVPAVDWATLQVGRVLGQGASGVIHEARWQPRPQDAPQPVAVKLFKGAVTSDGLPRSERATSLAAGVHPNLVGVEGRLTGHPEGLQGLVLRLIPADFRNLAAPPSFESCTRDVYAEGWRPSVAAARRIVQGVTAALDHLHRQGVVHGDLYAHNILVNDAGDNLLGDFGAASWLPAGDAGRCAALQRIDRRALDHLVEELAVRCDESQALRAGRVDGL